MSPNIVRINDDICKQLDRAPSELRQAYHAAGYGGANEWARSWKELVDTILRIEQFGLLTDASRAKALNACNKCLVLRIAVDDIYTHADRLRSILDPGTRYGDYPATYFQ